MAAIVDRRTRTIGFIAFAFIGCASGNRTPLPDVVTTEHGAVATVDSRLEKAAELTTQAFVEMGIRLKEVEMDSAGRGYVGTRNALSIRAELTRASEGRTMVTIVALQPASPSDAELARKVLERIIRKQD